MFKNIKIGLEIHQQLNTSKLFCDCISEISDDEPTISFSRKLRSVKSEEGTLDVASVQEEKKAKTFIYQGREHVNCLVESDEEPIHDINGDAVTIAVQVCKLLNAKIIDNIQVMRKIVIDGSNTSGFQRTCLVGMNGYLDCSFGKVSILSICLEEDSAKISERKKEFDVYNISRLGIPLIEISTGPDIKDVEHVREVAEKLGNLLRSLDFVKRGLGSIRQDVNVSFDGGERVEIKGVQDLKGLKKIVSFELERQKNLLEISNELKNKKFEASNIVDFSDILKNSEFKLFKENEVFGINLKNLKGFFGREIQPNRRFGTEVSDHAKVAVGIGGIIHADEIDKYISSKFIDLIVKKFKASKNDCFVLVCTPKEKAVVALDAVKEFVKSVFDGVLGKDVRKANQNFTSSYMRNISGSDRMYPETDAFSFVPNLDVELPSLNSDVAEQYVSKGLSKDLADIIVKRNLTDFVDAVASSVKNIKLSFIAESIFSFFKIHKDSKLKNEDFIFVFSQLDEDKISKSSIMDILIEVEKKGLKSVDFSKYHLLSDAEVEKIVKEVIKSNSGKDKKVILGLSMSKLKGKADSRKVLLCVDRFYDKKL